MKTNIPAIDLEISGVCNLKCPGCWGTPRMMKQVHTLEEWFSLVSILKKNANLKSVTVCGGEPLMIKGLDEFIIKLRTELDIDVYLETNGFFLKEHLPLIANHLKNISLPLEGSTQYKNAYRRGKDSFEKVIEDLDYLNEKYPDIPVKIGTCVFRFNLTDVQDIGKILLSHGFDKRYPNKGVWKLYQATRFGAGKNDKEWNEMTITDKEFRSMSADVKKIYKKRINITTIASNETGGYCIIIRPNGEVVSNNHSEMGEEFSVFPNIFKSAEIGIKAIEDFQSLSRVKNRLVKSYFFNWKQLQIPNKNKI